MTHHRSIRAAVIVCGALLLPACDDDPAQPADGGEQDVEQLVTALRSMSQPFQDIDAALAAGYEEASPCIANMGFHYVKPDRVDGTVIDDQPELLLYEPQADGEMRLVGVEYLVMAPDWDAVNDAPPSVAGQAFDDHRAENQRHGLPFPHYDLHVWIWEENTMGLFVPFNPAVACF